MIVIERCKVLLSGDGVMSGIMDSATYLMFCLC